MKMETIETQNLKDKINVLGVDFAKNPDLLVLVGSHLYGVSTPESDMDLRGFVVEPGEYLLGRKQFEQAESKVEDIVIWGAKKFFKLLEGFSPNTAEILFAPDSHILTMSEEGKLLRDNRHLFVAKKLVKPMQGFAFSEWKKAIDPVWRDKEDLGEVRTNHFNTYGYCLKNAYHAVRLLDQCIELLETGDMVFPRRNANYLQKIRKGEVHVDEIKKTYEELDAKVLEAYNNSKLPENPDRKAMDDLYYKVIEMKIMNFIGANYDVARWFCN